jgi:signal peptidase I
MVKAQSGKGRKIPLQSQLASEVWLEGTVSDPSTVEVATRGRDGVSRRVRVRQFGDGGMEVRPIAVASERLGKEKAGRSRLGTLFDRAGDALFVLALLLALGTATGFMTLHVVASGSMVPALNVGDVVVAISDEFSPPALGEVVIFKGTKLNGEAIGPFAHRIVGGSPSDGWVTKGDANESDDAFRSTSVEIMGRVLFSIPGLGLLLEPRTLLLILGGLVVFLLFR